jgi:hypothetical protein
MDASLISEIENKKSGNRVIAVGDLNTTIEVYLSNTYCFSL